ncbi:MAG TPA: right-handed parallel beta-helix repeat-containing protein [Gaiellaceae bacterium]
MRWVFALLALVALACVLLVVSPASAHTYYVSVRGNDRASGRSPARAWRSVARVNRAVFHPGDRVLFRGGTTFSGTALVPHGSGTRRAPIVFASYGGGRATIAAADGALWMPGNHDLLFRGLHLTTGGGPGTVVAGSATAPVTDITLARCRIDDTRATAVLAPAASDARWTIVRSTISHTGDSGIILRGAGHRVVRNRIRDTGFDTSIPYARHSIYSKGPDQTIAWNDISRDDGGQAVSIRFHGARVFANRIHDTAYAIGFFDYDDARPPQGTSLVYANRLWNISGWGFYYSGQAAPSGQSPSVSFVIASNTFSFSGASEAVNVSDATSARVVVANNIFTGTYDSAFRGSSTALEEHNLWSGPAANVPQGAGDRRAAPRLAAAPSLAPAPGSPAIDAGTAQVSGLAYRDDCGTGPRSFCGAHPDLGAVETGTRTSAPTRR